jgi:hypothetical protein
MLSCAAIDGILSITTLNPEIFELLTMMSICLMPESQLNPHIELAFGALAAAHTMSKFVRPFAPSDVMLPNMSPVFNELWDIYERHDRRSFPEVLSMFRDALQSTPMTSDEAVSFLINAVEKVMEGDFSKLSETMQSPEGDERDLLPEYRFDPEDG